MCKCVRFRTAWLWLGKNRGCSPRAGPVLESYFGSRALKRLILVGQEQGMQGAEARRAAAKLWTGAMEAQGVELASSHAAKVECTSQWTCMGGP